MDQLHQWIQQLADHDPGVRDEARHQLVRQKSPDATRELVTALIDPKPHVRWEAAKALQAIADPVAAPALMHALDDEHEDVRWVAAKALIALGRIGQLTVLSGLTRRAGSVDFCKAAHHVLRDGGDSPALASVRAALEQMDRAVVAPVAAYQAIVSLS